ncbi:phage tail protein [Photobacterium halotolerans]|uniref:Phage tail protein n=1 Tax=Photobacterium halotolerans TaxID=265726 RepID=A0A7X4WEW9_9GAMM|nr:phage tail protein [Photobacterium halotolerans]NAW66145.1 phage tail protein [Photobacterium halotolerans]
MSDFTAIGQLVTKGQELLDAIKGGAIRTMQNTFDGLMASVNSEWAAKKAQVDNEALAALERVDTESVRGDIGFTAQNYNNDFMDTVVIDESRKYPLRMGVSSYFNQSVKAEIIGVRTQNDPTTRPEQAKELLDFMGIGRNEDHFSRSFNILKLTILDNAFTTSDRFYDIYIPYQHLKISPSATFMAYLKTEGAVTENKTGMGSSVGEWKRFIKHYSSSNPGSYVHIDLRFVNANVGDVIYLALPTLTTGHFPESKKHALLYNHLNTVYRNLDNPHV